VVAKEEIINEIDNTFAALIFTYKNIGIKHLHNYYLNEEEIKKIYEYIKGGIFILQTCNRVEIYLHGENAMEQASSLLESIYSIHDGKLKRDNSLIKRGMEAIRHLFYVASGVDSIAVGEYEILNQIKTALVTSKKIGILDKKMERLVERGLKVGRLARAKTNISKGKVGIYSLALDKIKESIKDLQQMDIVVLGAGEIGSKMVELLYNEGIKNVTIMNRTLEKAEDLATRYGYKFAPLDLSKVNNFDVAISAIPGMPNRITIDSKKPIVLIDFSVPPSFQGENVLTLTELQDFSMINMANRLEELPRIDEIVNDGIREFISDYIKEDQNEIISKILNNVEKVREIEVEKAKKELRKRNVNVSQDVEEVLDVMSKSIVNKGLEPLINNIKVMVEKDERNYINFLIDLFNHGYIPDSKTKETEEQEASKGSHG